MTSLPAFATDALRPAAPPPEQTGIRRLLRLACRALGAPAAVVCSPDLENIILEPGAAADWPGPALLRRLPAPEHGGCAPLRFHAPEREVSALGVALELAGGARRVLWVLDRRVRTWSADDEQALADLAATLETEDALRRSESLAQRQRAEIELFYDSAPVGLCLLDRDLRYVRINRRLAEINGRPVAEHLGRLASELVPELAGVLEPLHRRVLRGESVVGHEVRGTTAADPDNEHVWLVSLHPLRGRDGTMVGINEVVQDITQSKHLEERLRRARDEAEEANRVKAEFLAMVSHELRTPLNGVIGYTEILEAEVSGAVNPAQRAQLEGIRSSADHLLQLIEEILGFARLEAGREEVRAAELDLRGVVRTAARLIGPVAERHGLALHVEVPDAPVVLVTDGGKLRQVLLNLLSNAVKFTDRGHVRVRLEQAAGEVRLSVEDTGVGIAPEHQEQVFEAFRQVGRPLTRTTGGTGLGLAITRRLVELLGGGIELHSELGRGSRFVVRLREPALSDR